MKSCGQSGYHLLSASGVGAHVMVNNVFDVLHVGSLPRPVHKHARFYKQHKTTQDIAQNILALLQLEIDSKVASAHGSG